MGVESTISLPGFTRGGDFEKFRAKARDFLRAHEDHVAIHKLRTNRPLTKADLSDLEEMLATSGLDGRDIDRAEQDARGLGLFV